MNKIVLALVLLIALSFVLFLVGNSYGHNNPLNPYVYLDYPQFSVIDEDRNIYAIDTAQRQVLVADVNGTLISRISGGDRSEGAFYYAKSIIPATDTFFVLNHVLDNNGMFVVREELLEYSMSGKFQRIFYQRLHETRKSTLVQRGEIFNPVVMQGYLYFFLVNETNIRMIRKSLQKGATEIVAEVVFTDAIAYIADIEWIDEEHFLILDKRGHLIRGDLSGNMETIYFQAIEAKAEVEEPASLLPSEYLSDMSISGNGLVYITDLINRQIVSIPMKEIQGAANSGTIVEYRPVLTREILSSAGFSDESFIYYRTGFASDGFTTSYDYGLYYVNNNGDFQQHEGFTVPNLWMITAAIRWVGIILGVLSLIALVIYAYIRFLTRRLSIMLKQALVIIPLMSGGIILISTILLQGFIAEHEANSIDKMLSLTQVMSVSVDGDRFHGVTRLSDYMNEDYRYIRNTLRAALNYNSDSWNDGLYFALYQVIDERLYGFMYLNNEIGLRHPFTWYEDDPQSVYRVALEGSVVFEQAKDVSGNFLYAIAPIYDSGGQAVALLEVGADLFSFQQNAQILYNRTIFYMSMVGISIISVILIMTFLILRNLGVLRRGVERIAGGDWDHKIDLKSNDEVSELGDRFNHMSGSITNYLNQIEVLNKSYQKFFPG